MSDAWTWADVQPERNFRPTFNTGLIKRPHGKSLSRFQGTPKAHGAIYRAQLAADHPAVNDGRTLFPSTVVAADKAPRILVSGKNAAKIGGEVRKGAWAGMPIFTLTLEERATCPSTCGLWRACYGNSMHLARRHQHGEPLERRLHTDLQSLARQYPRGFVVRLHVLGDFYSIDYAARWASWLSYIPALHVFGYTANPRRSTIGHIISHINARFSDRAKIRFSVAPDAFTTLF